MYGCAKPADDGRDKVLVFVRVGRPTLPAPGPADGYFRVGLGKGHATPLPFCAHVCIFPMLSNAPSDIVVAAHAERCPI